MCSELHVVDSDLNFVGGLAWISTSGALSFEPPRQPHFASRTSSFSHLHHTDIVLPNLFVIKEWSQISIEAL